jgi:hypothetical protein
MDLSMCFSLRHSMFHSLFLHKTVVYRFRYTYYFALAAQYRYSCLHTTVCLAWDPTYDITFNTLRFTVGAEQFSRDRRSGPNGIIADWKNTFLSWNVVDHPCDLIL